jgi:hypothetical protein
MALPYPIAITDLEQSTVEYDRTVVVSQSLRMSVFPALADSLLRAKQYDPRVGLKPSRISTRLVPRARCLHVDIAGSAIENRDWQHGKPTAAGVSAFIAAYVLPRVATK